MSARKAPPPKEIFHAATPINERAQVQFQTDMRRRILRAFVDAKEMLAYQHSGFSVVAGVFIEAHDCAPLWQKCVL